MDQTQDNVKNLVASRENFQTNWKNLGQPFWIKFITSSRYNVDIIDSKYNPHEFDYIFVEVLKNLVAKKFGKMFDYLVNVNKLVEFQIDIGQLLQTNYLQTKTSEQKQEYYDIFKALFGNSYTEIHTDKIKYIFELQCKISKTIIHLLKSQGKDMISFKFKIPSCWCEENCSAGPYEMFLRARWGDELSKLLDCKKEELKWWHAPAATSKTALSQPFNGALKLIYETPCKWLPSISDYPPLNIVSSVNDTNNIDFFTRLKLLKVPLCMWELIELSVPPVLARKFYLGRGGALVEDDDERHYLAICPWFVLWQNSFGIEYLNVLQCMHHEYEKNGLKSVDEDLTWEERMSLYKKVCTTSLSKYGAPYKIEECAESSDEFLLEPCFLIQLTYSPTLLQQWLAGALLEALKFDLASLEIRHFPMPVDSEPLARKILIINKQLKERILLGMCLLSQQVTRHPEFDNTCAVKLMDEVIMPAVPALEFLASGRANKALRHFKRVVYTRTRSTVDREMLTVPEIAYTIHKDLANIYIHHPFHLRYWLQDNKMFEPFPAKICENIDIDKIIKDIKNVEYDKVEAFKFTFQNYSLEEKSFLTDRKNDLSKVNPQVALQITKDLLTNKIKKDYFAKSESDLDGLLSDEIDNFVIQDDPSKLSLEHQAVQSVIMLQDIGSCMINMEKNPSWLSWLVRLSGEVMKKEQLIRLVTACALKLGQTPNISSQLSIHSTKPYEVKSVVTNTLRAQKLRDVRWLTQQFPAAWTNPILSPSLQLNPEEHRTLGDIVQTMEDRVGRLIYNVAMKYMKEGPESSSKYEALFSAQYLLPCYMSIHFCGNLQVLFFRNPLKCAVLSNFLITVIIRYECYFKIEPKKKKGKERYAGIELSQSNSINILPQSFGKEVLMASERVSKYLYERIQDFFSEYQAVDMIKIMYESMFDWPNYTISNRELCKVEGLILKAWQIVGTDHLRDARENCRQAWNLPKPGCALNNKDLKSVYHSSEVIARLSILTCRFGGDYPGLKNLREYDLLKKMMKILPTWRHDLLVRVLYTQNAIGISEEYATLFTDADISTFSKNYTELLSKVLGLMRRCREYLGYTLNTVISPNLGYESSHVTNHILDFNLGNIDNICKSLKLKHTCKGDAQAEVDIRDMALKYLNITIEPSMASSSGKPSKKTIKKKILPKEVEKTLVQCRNCHKVETPKNKFLACERCVKEKYPDVNYFCDSSCRSKWWEIEHMAEHLEFELGLC